MCWYDCMSTTSRMWYKIYWRIFIFFNPWNFRLFRVIQNELQIFIFTHDNCRLVPVATFYIVFFFALFWYWYGCMWEKNCLIKKYTEIDHKILFVCNNNEIFSQRPFQSSLTKRNRFLVFYVDFFMIFILG